MNISQCLNPECLYKNPPGTKTCERCGTKILLGDRYRAVGYIGKGSFGRTFLAVDEHRLDTPCVIKQFLPAKQEGADLEKAVQLFKQEAVRLRDLGKHPQIPDLEAFFEQEKRLYLIQEFIDGQDLLKEVHQRGRFSEQDIEQLLNELLPVLQFIHNLQVIHRDIKPSNIIRRRDNGSLVLIDFGVAKQQLNADINADGTVTGTIGYASPEQMLGKVVPASDLYSLGATCVRLLTGCIPKVNMSEDIYDPIEMRWRWREKVSVNGQLGRVLDKLTEYKVSQRYASAAEAIEALKAKPVINNFSAPQSNIYNPSRESTIQSSRNEPSSKTSKYLRYGVRNSTSVVTLVSEVGYDYTKLRDLLTAHKYKEADEETYKILLAVTNRQDEGWITASDIDKFPCGDLCTIDGLWTESSKSRFGFSVQKRIYENLGGTKAQNKKILLAFCDEVGWRMGGKWMRYADLSFALHAPAGHLPCGCPPADLAESMLQSGMTATFVVSSIIGALSSRLATCKNSS